MNSQAARCRSRQAGVTMVELIITMTIAGIVLTMGVSGYRYVTRSNRASSEINALLGDMQFARYEAVKEGEAVTICPASASATTCSTTTSWSGGWMVLSNALSGSSGNANVLRRQLPFSSFSSTDTLTATVTSVVFDREGYAMNLTGAGLDGTVVFALHDSTSTMSYTRCLMLGVSGVMQTGMASAYGSAGQILGKNCS
jgi:type IV fimbrial biogenesis protein FimT